MARCPRASFTGRAEARPWRGVAPAEPAERRGCDSGVGAILVVDVHTDRDAVPLQQDTDACDVFRVVGPGVTGLHAARPAAVLRNQRHEARPSSERSWGLLRRTAR